MSQGNLLNQFSCLKLTQRIYLALDLLLPWFHHKLPSFQGRNLFSVSYSSCSFTYFCYWLLIQIQHIYCTNRALVSIPAWAILLFLSLAMYMVTYASSTYWVSLMDGPWGEARSSSSGPGWEEQFRRPPSTSLRT
jgi:hypothetical protein